MQLKHKSFGKLNMYVVANQSFSSQQKLYEYTQNLINQLGECVIKIDDTCFIFFMELLKRHPSCNEKIGVGVCHFIIGYNMSSYQTKIYRKDATVEIFSWVACCKKVNKSDLAKLTKAMRSAVIEQIFEFKTMQIPECCICSSDINLEVDHKYPPFRVLVKEFLKDKVEIPNMFSKSTNGRFLMFDENDNCFEYEWQNYHKQNAYLQMLCARCNNRKK